MANNTKDNSKTSGTKKADSSSLWIAALAAIFIVALIFGLLVASENRFAGAAAFILFFSAGYFVVPRKGRRLYKLTVIALAIGMLIGSVMWEIFGRPATEYSESPTVFAVVVAFLGISIFLGACMVALVMVAATWIITPWVRYVGGHAEMDEGELRTFLLRTYLGISPTYVVVSGKDVIASSPAGIMPQLGGPGMAIIKPQTAVIFEHMGTTSRISGPATVKDIKMFELMKARLDLRPQWHATEVITVSTQDGELVQVSARYRSAIMRKDQWLHVASPNSREEPIGNPAQQDSEPTLKQPEVELPGQNPTAVLSGTKDYLEQTIYRATYDCGPSGWEAATREAVQWALRAEIERRTVEELFPAVLWALDKDTTTRQEEESSPTRQQSNRVRPDELDEISKLAQQRAAEVSAQWGVVVDLLSVDQITPPSSVTAATRSLRQSRVDASRTTTKGAAEANVYDALQRMEAEAQRTKLGTLMKQVPAALQGLDPEHVTAFFDLMEKLAMIMNQNRALDYRYVEAVEALSKDPNARIIHKPSESSMTDE